MNTTFNKRTTYYFVLLLFGYILCNIYLNIYILNTNLIKEVFGKDILNISNLDKVLKFRESFIWVIHLVNILLIVFKIGFTSVCILIGSILFKWSINFNKIFRIAVLSEFIFLLSQIIKNIILSTTFLDSLSSIQTLSPLSLSSVIKVPDMPFLIYALKTINIFELVYFFFLAYGLYYFCKKKYVECLKFVFKTYGIGLLIWIVIITNLNLYLYIQ
jgi:hypothetical protein